MSAQPVDHYRQMLLLVSNQHEYRKPAKHVSARHTVQGMSFQSANSKNNTGMHKYMNMCLAYYCK